MIFKVSIGLHLSEINCLMTQKQQQSKATTVYKQAKELNEKHLHTGI